MSRTSPTIVVTDTDQLSAIADAIVARAASPALSKNTVLNLIAGTMLGPKVNWGGLKSRSSPVQASRQGPPMMVHEEPTAPGGLPRQGDDVASRYWLDRDHLVLRIAAENTDTSKGYIDVCVAAIELPMIQKAIEGTGQYGGLTATFERDGNVLRITHHYVGGRILRFDTDLEAFQLFLLERHERILQAILEIEAVRSIHDAFVMVAQDQGEDFLFQAAEGFPDLEEKIHAETGEAQSRRIDRACKDAAWAFIAEAGAIRRGMILANDHVSLVNAVVDEEWTLLSEVMTEALENEVG